MRDTMGHQNLPAHTILALDTKPDPKHNRQVRRRLRRSHLCSHGNPLFRLLVSTFPRLLADTHIQRSMHNRTPPLDPEPLLQPKLRPNAHQHPHDPPPQSANGSQTKNPPRLSLLSWPLNNHLRNPLKTIILYTTLQRLLGLLVLSRILHRDDRHKHALLLVSHPPHLRPQILLQQCEFRPIRFQDSRDLNP